MKLSIIIPVYNEEQTIVELLKRVRQVKLPTKIQKEIIIVDDGSTDKSRTLIQKERRQFPEIKAYLSIINLGKGAAIRFGLKHATGDIILIQDADLELDPKEYTKLLKPILENKADVVYGSRFLKRNPNISIKTKVANGVLTQLTNFLYGTKLTDMETAYKAFRTNIIKSIRLRCVEFDFEPEVTAKIAQLGYKITEIPISYNPRRTNEGKKISFYDGLDAISTLVKNKLFPRPTYIRTNSSLKHFLNLFTFPVRTFVGQDWLELHGLNSFAQDRVQQVLPYLQGNALDIGAGENALIKQWRNLGKKGLGVDVYPWPGIDRVCDTSKLPYKCDQFNTVSFLACLNHIPNRKKVLKEANRVLAPDGRLIITMIDDKIGWICHKLIWWDKDQHERGMIKGEKYGLSNSEVYKLLKSSGFRISIEKHFSFLGLNHMYVCNKLNS